MCLSEDQIGHDALQPFPRCDPEPSALRASLAVAQASAERWISLALVEWRIMRGFKYFDSTI